MTSSPVRCACPDVAMVSPFPRMTRSRMRAGPFGAQHFAAHLARCRPAQIARSLDVSEGLRSNPSVAPLHPPRYLSRTVTRLLVHQWQQRPQCALLRPSITWHLRNGWCMPCALVLLVLLQSVLGVGWHQALHWIWLCRTLVALARRPYVLVLCPQARHSCTVPAIDHS